jgi:hypothetical protein
MKWVAILLVVLVCAPLVRAQTIGSQVIARGNIDTSSGQVYIYDGANFLSGQTFQSMEFYAGATGYVTPVLFEETGSAQFTVRGVGQSVLVSTLGDQSIDYASASGLATTLGSDYTFGFVNAAVDGSGNETASSTGVVDYDNYIGDAGVSPGSTNDWRFTPTDGGLNLAIGAVYGTGGFPLNAGGDPSNVDRTYSAIATAVPEPASVGVLFVTGFALLSRRRTAI